MLKRKKTHAPRKVSRKKRNSLKKTIKKARGKKAKTKKIKKFEEEKKVSPILIKLPKGPIISPEPENNWESWQTFNPGVILLEDKVHFLYRAIGNDGISRLGYAVSSDGFKIEERLHQPVYEHPLTNDNCSFQIFSFFSGGSFGGCEDPRPVRVNNEDLIYMTYTACDQGLRIALTSIKVDDFLKKKWFWKKPVFLSPPGQVHKNWVLFPEKIKGYYAILHSLNPKISIDYFEHLNFDGKVFIQSNYSPIPQGNHWNWEIRVRGAGPPPIKTKEGWLLFYHAESKYDPGKYKVGAMLLDLKDPSKVLCCAREPVIEPNEFYENNGFKRGVVYASGAVVKNNLLLVYYGASDSYVCVAFSDLDDFLKALLKEKKVTLTKKRVLKR